MQDSKLGELWGPLVPLPPVEQQELHCHRRLGGLSLPPLLGPLWSLLEREDGVGSCPGLPWGPSPALGQPQAQF